jgi:REP element-mobilizing transposase RayT
VGEGVKDISEKHDRRSLRLKDYNYSQTGAYFITIYANKLQPIFGKLKEGQMVLNGLGQIVQEYWGELDKRFLEVETDAFVIMPNHIHGIIAVGAIHELPLR